jgi:RluA family pseudouridine synthase
MNAVLQPGFEILYENGLCLAVNKPPGVLTQAPPGIDSMEVRIRAFLKQRNDSAAEIYLGVPHRLDRPVSGVMVFGLDRKATRRLAAQFESRRVRKTYWACVSGVVQPSEGTWTDSLRKVPGIARAEVVDADHAEGREAMLHYRTLASTPWGSWLEIELETGRMHQVRVQAASRGHPLLGDGEYGSSVGFGPPSDDFRLRPIALHARSLTFKDPVTRQQVALVAPLPDVWARAGLTPIE